MSPFLFANNKSPYIGDTMNYNRLRERQTAIKATPLPNRASSGILNRRQLPKNDLNMEDPVDRAYPNFFEFEEDLSKIKSSAELFEEIEKKNSQKQASEHTFLEPLSDSTDKSKVIDNTNNITQNVDTSDCLEEFYQNESEPTVMEEVEEIQNYELQFIQCEFIKQNGERCKRQAPKNHKLCSKHKNLTIS